MLFNSHTFLFVFLPLVFAGFCLLSGRRGTSAAIAWLVLCSLFFYSWWRPAYLILILSSVAVNYALARLLAHVDPHRPRRRQGLLALGIVFNLALLGYFKYASFFLDNINALTGWGPSQLGVVLPLAISFFTFQQIAYLVDCYRAPGFCEVKLLRYTLFVTFFPQLIAGPIVHHRDIVPQMLKPGALQANWRNLALGSSIFFAGLFKKTMIADRLAGLAEPIFATAAVGGQPALLPAWDGALAYTLQLYFDFSGYSDMAIGLGLLFGLRLPINFNSPYKAISISDFWRRWHITLSSFLRDYLYIPLGGNRKGLPRYCVNLLIVMVLGGLWHGAGWTFVCWGALHGVLLLVHRAWLAMWGRSGRFGVPGRLVAQLLTFLSVMVGWIFFRADSLEAAGRMLSGMAGLHGIGTLSAGLPVLLLLVLIAMAAPNTQTIFGYRGPGETVDPELELLDGPRWYQWRPSPAWAAVGTLVVFFSLLGLANTAEFVYFQF